MFPSEKIEQLFRNMLQRTDGQTMGTNAASAATHSAINRRGAMKGIASAILPAISATSASPAASEAITKPATPEDERLMREALALAARGDFPFGAVIAQGSKILAHGYNLGKRTHDPTAHGEMVAIRRFLAAHGQTAFKGTALYTTGEPCAMCMGAIIWCGTERVVYAASIAEIAAHLGQIGISCTEIAAKTPFERIAITGGVLAADALKLFR